MTTTGWGPKRLLFSSGGLKQPHHSTSLLYRQASLSFSLKRQLQHRIKVGINFLKAAGRIERGIPGYIAKRREAHCN